MSYEVLIKLKTGRIGGYYFGSGSDLMDLSGWLKTLPDDVAPNLKSLILDGGNDGVVDTQATCMEIDPLLEAYPPGDEGVEATADQLADTLDRWPDETLALLSDGANTPEGWYGEDDEDEDESVKDG